MTKPRRPSPRRRGTTRTALLIIAKWVMFLVVVVFVGRSLVVQCLEVQWSQLRFRPGILVAAAASALAGKAVVVVAFRSLLRPFCQPPGWREMMTVAWIPPIGKYIPGKVASVAGAVWLLARNNVPGAVAVGVVFILNGLMVVLGLILSIPLIFWGPIRREIPWAWPGAMALIVGGLIFLHPKVFSTVGNFVLRKMGRQPVASMPRVRDYPPVLLAMLGQSALLGLSLWLVTYAITDISAGWILYYISAMCLASTLGFLAVFAPGGLGVREGILLFVLGFASTGGGAVAGIPVVVILDRILKTVVEIVLAGIGFVIMLLLPKKPKKETGVV